MPGNGSAFIFEIRDDKIRFIGTESSISHQQFPLEKQHASEKP